MTLEVDHPSSVQHALGSTYVFSTLFQYWVHTRGVPKGLVHNLLQQFFILVTSKIAVSDTYFFRILTTQNDHATYVKHVLGSIYVFFFTLFGYWYCGVEGGGAKGFVHNLLVQLFTVGSSKIQVSEAYPF